MSKQSILYSSMFILMTFASSAQKSPTMDKLFLEVQGEIKTITVLNEKEDDIERQIYYFTPDGDIEKIEQFNSNSDFKNQKIATISYFDKQVGQTRYFYRMEMDSKKVIEKYSIELLEKHTFQFSLESLADSTHFYDKTVYNNQGQRLKSTSEEHVLNDINRSQQEYFYDAKQNLEYSIYTNFSENSVLKLFFKNAVKDKHGNFTYAEHVDENETVIFKLVREYTYY